MTYCKDYCEEKGISTSKLNEAQKTLYYIAENMKMEKSISEEGYKHFQMAIKALEQQPILDKIRNEIEQLPTTKCTETHRIYIDADDFKKNVLVILDKYKAESEE